MAEIRRGLRWIVNDILIIQLLADTFSSLGQFVRKRRLTCCVEVQSCLI
jgi:hypothetical protein